MKLKNVLNNVIIKCVGFILIGSGILFANGTNSFSFLKMNIGSRAQGMGNAFTAMAADLNSIYYNPAGIGFSYRPSLMFFHGQLYEDLAVENFSSIYPFKNRITLSFGLSYLHLPALKKYDINPLTGEFIDMGAEFQVYDFVPQIGISYRFKNELAVGVQVKYLQERIDNVTASGFAFDVGILYKVPVDFLSVGASIQNLGPDLKYETVKESIPLTYRLGIAYQIPQYMITFSFDGVKTVKEDWNFHPGMEVEFLQSFALRAGYQFQQDVGGGYNVGAGFNFLNNYGINYVFSPYGILGSTHKAEISVHFGGHTQKGAQGGGEYYSYSYDEPEIDANRNISYFLPVPAGLKADRAAKDLILSWDAVNIKGIQYNVYVQIKGKTGLVKINKKPVLQNSYTFSPTVSDLKLRFFVCTIKNEKESEFSKSLDITYK
ncbi:MAG: fibronectin type III domain-containing protein [Calditrichia bacterium]|nr:fibronectin type III domain-containing protein [Calditrichia bacterium]